MQGYDAVMFTGTDEHGQKVERAAQAVGKTPQEFTDAIAAEFRKQWEKLGHPGATTPSAPPTRAITQGAVAVRALPR